MSETASTPYSGTHEGFSFVATDPVDFGPAKETPKSDPEPAKEAASEDPAPEDGKDPHAVALGARGGAATAAKRAAEKESQPDQEAEEAKTKAAEEIQAAPPEQKKKLASDRVGEATRAAAEAKRALERERQQLDSERRERAVLAERLKALEARISPPDQPKSEQDPDKRPDSADFPDWKDYLDARDAFNERQLLKKFQETRRSEAEQFEAQQRATQYTQKIVSHVDTFNSRMSEASKSDPDFLSRIDPRILELKPTFVLEPNERPSAENDIADEITGSTHAKALMLHFTEHPEDFQRIAALRSTRDVAREMAKLEDRLERAISGTPPTKHEVSKASPPVRPVTGAPAVTSGFREGEDFESYAARNQEAIRKRIYKL